MDTAIFFQPLTAIVEMVWCAREVGCTWVEALVCAIMLLGLGVVIVHMLTWQRRVALALIATQQKVDATAETLQSLCDDLHGRPASTSSSPRALDTSPWDFLRTELDVLKKQHMDVLSSIGTIHGVAKELTEIHKAVSNILTATKMDEAMKTQYENLSKLSVGTTSSLKTLLASHAKASDEAAKTTLQQTQTTLERKLEDLLEKVEVIRVVVHKKTEALLTANKDGQGWISSQTRDIITLVRGLGPCVSETKRVGEVVDQLMQKTLRLEDGVFAGRRQSDSAQQTLQTTSDTMQNVEHRVMRIEGLVTGIVDQHNELEGQVQRGNEALQDQVGQTLTSSQELERRSTTFLGNLFGSKWTVAVTRSRSTDYTRIFYSQGERAPPQNFLITPVPAPQPQSGEALINSLGNFLAGQR
ncbi:unnamed protein product [Symbiodinium sp. CCMP2456]|nr:unnamed protein product [Symbiodinium sp. CCMP2456]